MTDKEKYDQLVATINYHMDRYYNQDAPEISDYEYDQLMQQLKEMEKANPKWVTADSPTQKIGGTTKREAGVKVVHNVPMLSIEDVFTKEEVTLWIEKVHAVYPDAKFSVETKIDGLSMTLRYQKNPQLQKLELVMAETRGDGLVGEDVTANALTIPDVQKTLDLDYDYLELRGEVYMAHEDFERFNDEQEKSGKKLAANPRNLAAGTLRQLDTAITKQRGLRMFVFNVQQGPEEIMQSHVQGMELLQNKGVACTFHKLCQTADEVHAAIDEIGQMRENLTYDLDGAVIKIDETALRSEFGGSSKYTSGHIAYKYPPEERVIEMDEIQVDVGRTGKLTFTGIFHDPQTGKPARLCGTSVSRATLHNQDYITGMKIGIGGTYKLFKSGEIIPKLNGCVTEPAVVFQAPTLCPICKEPLVREEDTADIRCINPACPAQLTRTIAYFTSLNCMNIMGLGDTLVDTLVNEGYLKSYADIYKLKNDRDELIEKGLIGKEKNTDKVLAAIEKSKMNDPVQFLTALGIRNVGRSTAREIMKHYESIEELSRATVEDLTAIPDVGGVTAECIVSFFKNETNELIIKELSALGVNMKMPQKEQGEEKLSGMTFVVTGDVHIYKNRGELKKYIEEQGGKVAGSVSKKTAYLINNDTTSNSSKNVKAKELGIPIISEEDFNNMFHKEI